MSRSLRTLLFSTLYPGSARPGHGIFVETRLRELLKLEGVEARVVAPVAWFPSTDARHGERAALARTPRREEWNGIDVLHPRYPLIPKVGMTSAPLLLALGARRSLRRLIDEGFDFDVIDAHYCYPDGVAAALLARWFDKPLVVTARGSDVNLIAQFALPRRMIRWSLRRARAAVGVSEALAARLRDIGASPDRVHVLRNGVDAERFRPEPAAAARARLGVGGEPLLLSVGNLLAVKRHHLVIEALALLRSRWPGARLALVGGGELRAELEAKSRASGVADAVHFAGQVPQDQLRWWYSAADLLVLASSREGWPNVLLEAMACGTPVLASRVGGVPEVVSSPVLGAAVEVDDARALADAAGQLVERALDRDAVRQHALRMSWEQTSRGQLALFREVVASDRPATGLGLA